MAYTKTDWVDNSTLVSEALMDKIEQGIFDAHAGLPPTPVNGQWLTAAGGAMLWSALPASISPTIVDAKGDLIVASGADAVARQAVGNNGQLLAADSAQANGVGWRSIVGATAVQTVSAANTDLAWIGAYQHESLCYVTTVGGTLRSLGAPTAGTGTVIVIRNGAGSGSFTILHQVAGGAGARFWLLGSANLVLLPGELATFMYDGANWLEISRDVAGGGGGGLDWEGTYNPATAYVKGDVVTYNGVTYGAVNDSTGQTPPPAFGAASGLVTSLPGSPFDGQEVILVDSLTAPTYQWHLRYVAAKASNKWVFLGGPSMFAEVLAQIQTSGTSYADYASVGPDLTAPVTGEYELNFGCWQFPVANVGTRYMTPKFGAAAAVDADGVFVDDTGQNSQQNWMRRTIRRTIAGGTLVRMQYRATQGNLYASHRSFQLTPVAVGG